TVTTVTLRRPRADRRPALSARASVGVAFAVLECVRFACATSAPRQPFEETLEELEELLREARTGARLALLDGPEGVGMEEVLRLLEARARGLFLRVRAEPGHPLAPVEAMIAPLLERRRTPSEPLDPALGCAEGCHALW